MHKYFYFWKTACSTERIFVVLYVFLVRSGIDELVVKLFYSVFIRFVFVSGFHCRLLLHDAWVRVMAIFYMGGLSEGHTAPEGSILVKIYQ